MNKEGGDILAQERVTAEREIQKGWSWIRPDVGPGIESGRIWLIPHPPSLKFNICRYCGMV